MIPHPKCMLMSNTLLLWARKCPMGPRLQFMPVTVISKHALYQAEIPYNLNLTVAEY